jgi:signal peptidase I
MTGRNRKIPEVVTVEPHASSSGGSRSATPNRWQSGARAALAALWFAIIPALLALLAVRDLVPTVVPGNHGVAKDAVLLSQEYPVPVAIGLVLLFAAVTRYWRFSLPGGRYLSEPAPLVPVLATRQRRELLWVAAGMAVAAGAAFGLRRWLLESYSVLSASMLPTLQPEDRVGGNRVAYVGWSGAGTERLPRRGDIIVFKSTMVDEGNLTDAPADLVKRVIGLPGDRISMRGGIPIINGWTVPVCDAGEYLYILHGGDNGLNGRLLVEFLDDRAYLTVHAVGSAAFTATYEVRPGELFVLGDNRNNSSDSRAWNHHQGGGVPLEAVEARMQWFIAGRRADRRWDFGRLLAPLDSLATKIHLDGVDLRPVQDGIERCLQKRAQKTHPPSPSEAASAARPDTRPGR